jgi:hypothetical protein
MRSFRRGDRASSSASDHGGGVATIDAPQGSSAKTSRRNYDPAWDDWDRPRRWPGVLLSCIIVLAFMAVVIWHFRPHVAPIPHHTNIVPSKGQLKLPFVVGGGTTDVVATFKGTTDSSSHTPLSFTSNGDLLVLHAICVCQYNFDVTVDQGFDNPVVIPISGLGSHNTALDLTLPKGTYQFQVVGSGPWKLVLIQPQANLPLLPTPYVPSPGCGCHEFSYFSEGNSVIGPFSSADGHLALAFLSSGHGEIFTRVLNMQGTSVAVPLYGKSPYEHSVTLRNLPNPYYLEVSAVGFWKVEVRPSAKS